MIYETLQVENFTLKVTLTDFDLAKLMSNTSQAGTRTMLAGSPGYQSPEQLKAEKIGTHCDIIICCWRSNFSNFW